MTEVLGDAVLDLVVDATQAVAETNAFETFFDRKLAAMAGSVKALQLSVGNVGSGLSDQTRPIAVTFDAVASSTLGLVDVFGSARAESEGLRSSLLGLGTDATAMSRAVNAALDSISAHAISTATVIAATSVAERKAIESVTGAWVEQAAVLRGISDLKSLGPGTGMSGAALSALGSGGSRGQVLYGVRGTQNVGSRTNPMAFALEAGSRANLGDLAAAVAASSLSSSSASGGSDLAAAVAALTAAIPRQGPSPAVTAGTAAVLTQLAQRGTASPSSVQRITGGSFSDASSVIKELERAGYVGGGSGGGRSVNVSPSEARSIASAAIAADAINRSRPQLALPVGGSTGSQSSDDLMHLLALQEALKTSRPIPGQKQLPSGSGTYGDYGPFRQQSQSEPDGVYAATRPTSNKQSDATATAIGDAAGEKMADRIEKDLGQGGKKGGGGGGGGGVPWSNILWNGGGGGGGGGGGRRLPGWGGYLLGGAAGVGASFGTVGSFAGLGAEHIILTLGGIAGSAVNAAGGAGVLGAGALGKIAVGGGSDLAISASTLSDTKQLATAYSSLSSSVQQYGKGSQQAIQAQSNLVQLVASLQNTVGVKAEETLAKNANNLNAEFDKQSGAARVQAANIFEQMVTLGNTYLPLMLQAAQQNLSIINTGIKPLFAWLEGPQGIAIWDNLENNFKRDLPTAINAFDQGMEVLLRVVSLASNYTGGLTKELDAFFTRVNSEPNQQLNDWVQKMVGDFRVWDNFIKALGHSLVDLFKNDAGTGQSIIVTLTGMLDKLDAYEKSSQGQSQLSNIFEVHKQEVLQLLQLVPELTSVFGSFYLKVAPPLTEALTGIIHLMVGALNDVAKLGPVGTTLAAVALVLAKLSLLGPGLRATGLALGLIAASEDAAAVGGAALTGGTAASTVGGVATAAAGGGILSKLARLSPTAMGASLASKLAGGTEAGLTAEGLAPFLAGGLGAVGGLAVGAVGQHVLGLRGGTASTVAGGVGGAAAGAAIGSLTDWFSGPFGTLIGGAIGGALGPSIVHVFDGVFGIKSGQSYGDKFASGFVQPFQGIVSDKTGKALRESVSQAATAYKNAQSSETEKVTPTGIVFGPANAASIEAAAMKLGKAVGMATVQGLQSVAPSTFTLNQDFIAELQKLPAQARPQAAQAMLAYANQLMKSGNLPENALSTLIASLEGQFPGLQQYLKSQGEATDKDFAQTMAFTQAKGNLTQTLETMRTEFDLFSIDKNVTGANLLENVGVAYKQIKEVIATSTGQAQELARQNLKTLQEQTSTYFGDMLTTTEIKMSGIKASMGNNLGQASLLAYDNLSSFQQNVHDAMSSGALSTQQGMKLIAEATNATLKAFGAKPLATAALVAHALSPTAGLLQPGSTGLGASTPVTGAGSYGVAAPGAAGGALMQIGRPGEAGRDIIPMSVGGQNIMVGPGEKVAVINRHQAPMLDYAVANTFGYAGLGGFFGANTKPNYMSAGGFLPGFASGGTLDYAQLEGLWDQAGGPRNMAALMAAIAEAESAGNPKAYNASGASGLWQILGAPFAGNVFDPLTNARMAVAKLRSQGLGAWQTYTEGSYKQFLKGNVPATAAAMISSIMAPTLTKGFPALDEVGDKALTIVANAANAYLNGVGATESAGSTGSSINVGNLPTGGGFSSSQLGTFDGMQVAKWIIPELAWAAQHGWGGTVTSGWRSPGEVVHGEFATAPQGQSEHQYDIYPGGAVDVSDYQQFAQIIRGYPGADKLIQLGIDPLHFSGTGHASGGMVDFATDTKGYHRKDPKKARHKITPPTRKGTKAAGGHAEKKPKLIKGVKLKALKNLPGLNQSLLNKISTIENFTDNGLENWQTYILAQHGLATVEPTVTLADGSTVLNWGDTQAPIGELTGVIDPTTGQVTKSIYDRIREIGYNVGPDGKLAGLSENITSPVDPGHPGGLPVTELGLDNEFLQEWGEELSLAQQIAYGKTGDNRSFGSWLTPRVKKLQDYQAKVSDLTEANRLITEKTRDLAPERTARDAAITSHFAQLRHSLANKNLSAGASKNILLNNQIAFLAEQERQALASLPTTTIPANLQGGQTKAALALMRSNVTNEFDERTVALQAAAAKIKLGQELSYSNATFALSQEESADKNAVAQQFDYGRINLENQATDNTAHKTQDSKEVSTYQTMMTAAVGNKTGSTAPSQVDAQSFYGTLLTYLDPNGALRLTNIKTMQNVGIPSLVEEASSLMGTPLSASAATTDLQAQQLQLLQQLTEEQSITIEALNAQNAVFQNLGNLPLGGLPAFGGSFATGGIVPGAWGEPRTVIAHAGEKITPGGGGGNLHINFGDGMGWLKNFVSTQIEQNGQKVARTAGRNLPSRGGGLLTTLP